MPISDKKKCWHVIYAICEEVVQIKASNTRLQALKALWQADSPDTTGTPLDGNVAAVNTFFSNFDDLATSAIADAFAAYEDRRLARHKAPSAYGEGI